MIENTENLREQVMISQFVIATGCTKEQAHQLLQSCRWEFEMALSCFFQEAAAAQMHRINVGAPFGTMVAPTNTPATPPSFGDVLLTLGNLKAGCGAGDTFGMPMSPTNASMAAAMPIMSPTGVAAANVSSGGVASQGQQKVLSPCNCMSPPLSVENRYYINNYCDWPLGMMSPPMSKQPNYPPPGGSASTLFHRQTSATSSTAPTTIVAGGSPPNSGGTGFATGFNSAQMMMMDTDENYSSRVATTDTQMQ